VLDRVRAFVAAKQNIRFIGRKAEAGLVPQNLAATVEGLNF